jgi:hypothetical protein
VSKLSQERRAADRDLWTTRAARLHFGVCQACGRDSDSDDRPLLVARQERCRNFLCLDCWSRGRPR